MASDSAVAYVGFSIRGDRGVIENSHVEITNSALSTVDGIPIAGGVYDSAMGTIDNKYQCLTCMQGKKNCPGHFGHLNLKVAVVLPICIGEIRRWLRVICHQCATIMVGPDKYQYMSSRKRLAEVSLIDTAGKKCPNPECGAVHPKIVKDADDHFTFWIETNTEDKKLEKLRPDTIKSIFERVTNQTVVAMGRNINMHPSKTIQKVIAVPPSSIRPGVKSHGSSGGGIYHDVYTSMIQHIVKRNNLLPDTLPDSMGPLGNGAIDIELDKASQNLQQLVFDLIIGSSGTSSSQGNSGKRGLTAGSRPVKSILSKLQGKEGQIRKYQLAKRVWDIGRSTISGNVQLKPDEVGIPIDFARILQVRETVQEYNKEWLMSFFLNGRRQYPGCTHVIRKATGEMHDVAGMRNVQLEVGDQIYRDLTDGDFAFFNRAPTLERSSISVHKVRIIQDSNIHTFQMNVLSCIFFGADFDGDQMTIWVAKSPGTQIEANLMSSLSNWFISSKNSGPVTGQVQDSVIGCYEMTRSNVRLDKYHAMSIFADTGMQSPRFDLLTDDHVYTGREMVSMALEHTPISYRRPPTSFNDLFAPYINYKPDEVLTNIERGTMISGVLDKKSIGGKAEGGIYHIISREYGTKKALDIIYAFQRMSLQYLMYSGFTVGLADLLPPPESVDHIRDLVAGVELESKLITDKLMRGGIVPPIGVTVAEFYESLQKNALKNPESEVLRWILKGMHTDTNGLFNMINVGSKGGVPNLIHISGAIGQTLVNGERIQETFAFGRTTPYSYRFTTDPEAYGFVSRNYIIGLGVLQYFCQNSNGRHDLISKALATASTGSFMRKGAMTMQSCVVNNRRMTVKDVKIVQILHGDDGLDPREVERVEFRTIMMSDVKLLEFVSIKGLVSPSKNLTKVLTKAYDKIRADRDVIRNFIIRGESSTINPGFGNSMWLPFNVKRIVDGILISLKNKPDIPLTEEGIISNINKVWELCNVLPYTLINEIQERRRSPIPKHIEYACTLLCISVRSELNPQIIAKLTGEHLEYIFDNLRQKYANSLIEYGSAVGIVATQAISEPLTQYMLDSHHRSVSGGTTKAGLMRISEIYGAKGVEYERSSSMLLPISKDMISISGGNGRTVAMGVVNSIVHVSLRNFSAQHEILLEPYNGLVYPPYMEDTKWLNYFIKSHPLILPPGDLTNWCFRIVIDKAALILNVMDLEVIVKKLRAKNTGIYITHTPESTPNIIIRIWVRSSHFKQRNIDEISYVKNLLDTLLDTTIRGIEGIVRATVDTINRKAVNNDDGSFADEERFAVSVVGTNLYQVSLHAAVDKYYIVSSSIGDTFINFGIEAARDKMISETLSFMAENTPNLRHLQLYADVFTQTGKPTSIERGAQSGREQNVFLNMAYGAPQQAIIDASLENVQNPVYGIAAHQMLGSTPQIGTLYNGVVVDEEFVKSNIQSVDSFLDALL